MSTSRTKEEIIEVIAKETGKSSEEIQNEITKTVELMDNMVNEEGAAYVVANNLGVNLNLDQTVEPFKIGDLIAGQSNISTIARIKRIFSIREFTRKKDGTQGQVRNLILVDNSGEARLALWDKKVSVIEDKSIKTGDIIRVIGANTKLGYQDQIELSLGSNGSIDNNIEDINLNDFPEIEKAPFIEISHIELKSELVSIEGIISHKQELIEFEKEGRKGKVTSFTIKDLSGQSRIIFWNELTELAEKYELGDVIKITDLRPNEGRQGLELVYNDFSTITKSEETKYSEILSSDIKDVEISKLTLSSSKVNLKGRLIYNSDVNLIEKEDKTLEVANFVITDNIKAVKVTLWNEKAKLLEGIKLNSHVALDKAIVRSNNYSGVIELTSSNETELREIEVESTVSTSLDEVKLEDFIEITNSVSIKLQVTRIFEDREFVKKSGDTGKVKNLGVVDIVGTRGKIVAWDSDSELIDHLDEGSTIFVHLVRVKPNDEYGPEISINRHSVIEDIDSSDFSPIIQSASQLASSKPFEETTLDAIMDNQRVKITGIVVKAFNPVIYLACNQCSKKVTFNPEEEQYVCRDHGNTDFVQKMIITAVMDDETGTCNVKFFDKLAEKLLGMTASEVSELINRLSDENAPVTKSKILLKEIWVEGFVSFDENYGNSISVRNFEFVDINAATDQILNKFESM